MTAPPVSINLVVPETPPCSQAAAETPQTLLSQPDRCPQSVIHSLSQSDSSPVRLPALGDANCIGDTLRIDDDHDSGAAGGSSSEGEDIMHSDVLRKDYKSIPHLDSYSSLAVDDSASVPALSGQQRRSADAEMERRDRIAQLRQQAVGSAVPRAIGGAVDELDIIEMMERRSKADATAVVDDPNSLAANEESSVGTKVASVAIDSLGAVEGSDTAAAVEGVDTAAAASGDSETEGSFSGSEDEESGGSWSGEDDEGGDSDIEEFYLKGGEGQMDDVEKKRKIAAEQKLVMVQLEKERQMKKNLIMLPCAAPVKPSLSLLLDRIKNRAATLPQLPLPPPPPPQLEDNEELMIVFDEDELNADLTHISSGCVGKVMPRRVMLGELASAPDSMEDADSPRIVTGMESTLCDAGVDSVVLDTLALAKDPLPPAADDGAGSKGAEQQSMLLFFDDSDLVENTSSSEQVAPAVAAVAAAAAPPPPSEAKVYGRKSREGGVAGGITAFFAPAPKVVDAPLPPATVEEEDVAADFEEDADDDGDDDGAESDADSVDSSASLARRLMEEQRRRQQEAFKVPVAAQVKKDIIDMVGEKGRYLRDGDESDSGESEPSDAIDLADTDGEGESEEEAADVADSEDERFLREGDEAKEDVDYERLATMRRVHMEEEDAEAAQQVYDIIGGKRRLEQIEREKQMLAQEEWMPNRAAREGAMRLSDDEEEDEDPVLRGKRLWKQWQQSRMQQNEDDAAQGDEEDCSAAESLLQALSKSKKLKRFKPLSASLSVGDSLGDGSLRSSINVVGHAAAADPAASTVAPLVSAHIQQLSRTSSAGSFKVSSLEDITVSSAVRTATKGMYFERAATPSSAADDGDSAAAMDWGAGEKTKKYAKAPVAKRPVLKRSNSKLLQLIE